MWRTATRAQPQPGGKSWVLPGARHVLPGCALPGAAPPAHREGPVRAQEIVVGVVLLENLATAGVQRRGAGSRGTSDEAVSSGVAAAATDAPAAADRR